MVLAVTQRKRMSFLVICGGVALRLLFLAYPSSAVFDEMHYARFIGKYLRKENVLDVHPPLGRIALYFVTKISLGRNADLRAAGETLREFRVGGGFDGTALEHVYPLLRAFSAISSLALCYVGYLTFLALGVSKEKSAALSSIFLFESAMHSMFRLIMLDSHVVLCVSVILLCLIKMNKNRVDEERSCRRIGKTEKKKENSRETCATTPEKRLKNGPWRAERVKECPDHAESALIESTPILLDCKEAKDMKPCCSNGRTRTRGKQKLPLPCAQIAAASFSTIAFRPEKKRPGCAFFSEKHPVHKNEKVRDYVLHKYWKEKKAPLGYSALLGAALGVGASLKWSVLPMGAPIAFTLLVDLFRSLRNRKRSALRWTVPVLQGLTVLAISLSIYVAVFLLNFRVQDEYSPGSAHWYSFRYNASLKKSPYENYRKTALTDGAEIAIGAPEHKKWLCIRNKQLALAPSLNSSSQDTLWKISVQSRSLADPENTNTNTASSGPSTENVLDIERAYGETDAKETSRTPPPLRTNERPLFLNYSAPFYLKHSSGLFLSDSADTRIPAELFLERNGESASIRNKHNKYLKIRPDGTFEWSASPSPLLLLAKLAKREKTRRLTEKSSEKAVYSSQIEPLGPLSKIAEANLVMFRCNKGLKSEHRYVSHPAKWMHPLKGIHMWNGGVSDTANYSRKYAHSSQIFFTGNPVLWAASVISVLGCSAYLVLTETPRSSFYSIILLSYFSTYLPYFFLDRDTYLHHYLPPYYVSLVLLGFLLSHLPESVMYPYLLVCVGFFCLQYPLLIGSPISYEACRLSYFFGLFPGSTELLCNSFDSSPLLNITRYVSAE